MSRSRVLSFMSTFSGPPRSPTFGPSSGSPDPIASNGVQQPSSQASDAPPARDSPTPVRTRERAASRPTSMIGGYQAPLMDTQGTIPELQNIFNVLNSHSNKLYQEGYFLKLNDLDSHGRPFQDRSWTECFAQLVGTVLSLWDAAALDAAGQDGEVAPTFINLSDASIKMIETLPTRSQGSQPLQNVLSISTAGKNRYLLHFSNIHALTQWTAGIRLAIFENASLQEVYTGCLIAGKGKHLNNIKVIMGQTKFRTEEWVRVRFGAGTPWRRCWCVISPPDEKEVQKAQKAVKKKSAYDRSVPVLKGDMRFYDTKKTKKTLPIATIRDAYAAYAIYPQSKPLIEQSTLLKVEGVITIHSSPETTTEGFVFVMPEVRPAVSGFEMLLRFLFPIWDVFALYGRPARLLPDTLDPRSLMFAMPQERRYGYLEILDVSNLIHGAGSQNWNEREWKLQMKQLTSQRISKMSGARSRASSRAESRAGGHHSRQNSLPSRAAALKFQDNPAAGSTPSLERPPGQADPGLQHDSPPPGAGPYSPPLPGSPQRHGRSVSDAITFAGPRRQRINGQDSGEYRPSRLSKEHARPRESIDEEAPPPPPVHMTPVPARAKPVQRYPGEHDTGLQNRSSSESDRNFHDATSGQEALHQEMSPNKPPSPVTAPPAFNHQPGAMPARRPVDAPDLRRANSRMSTATLSQLAAAGGAASAPLLGDLDPAAAEAATAWKSDQSRERRRSEEFPARAVNGNHETSVSELPADDRFARKGVVLGAAHNSANANLSAASYPSEPPPNTSFAQRTARPQHDLPQASSVSETSSRPMPISRQSAEGNPEQSMAGLSQPSPSLQHDGHSPTPSTTTITASGAPATPTGARRAISRKPLPSPSQPSPPASRARQSDEDLRRRVIDEAAINRVNTLRSDAAQSESSQPYSDDGHSHYETDSPASPDYHSFPESIHVPPPRREQSRTGVLKTVGDDPSRGEVILGDTRYRTENAPPQPSSAPAVDFGPTESYQPGVNSAAERSFHRDLSSEAPRGPVARGARPSDLRSASRLSGDGYAAGPQSAPLLDASRTGSAGSEDVRRSLLWQPGMGNNTSSGQPRPALTPEQYVQQRAAANRVVPTYAGQRSTSHQNVTPPASAGRAQSRTPPLVGNHSRQSSSTPPLSSRQASADYSAPPPARPGSRGAVRAMNQGTMPDYSQHLSAREQEHVARMTGSPLLNMNGSGSRNPSAGGGLVGAIEAREHEKRAIKEGLSGHMVQQAIEQRKHQHAPTPNTRTPPRSRGYGSSQMQPSPHTQMPGYFPQTPDMRQGPPVAHPGYGQQESYGPPPPMYQYAPASQYPQQPSPAHGGSRPAPGRMPSYGPMGTAAPPPGYGSGSPSGRPEGQGRHPSNGSGPPYGAPPPAGPYYHHAAGPQPGAFRDQPMAYAQGYYDGR